MGYGYVPITVTNSESSATSTNFQQLVTVDLSYYSSFLNADLSNTFFSSDSAGSTVLNSWLESGNTYPFSSVNFWVVLSDGIAANSSTTIYLQVDLSNANHFNTTTTGESPLLSTSYGEYDNGADVFSSYQAWGGLTAIPTGWSVYNPTNIFGSGVEATYILNSTNIEITYSNSNGFLLLAKSYSTTIPYIIESLVSGTDTTNTNFYIGSFTENSAAAGVGTTAGFQDENNGAGLHYSIMIGSTRNNNTNTMDSISQTIINVESISFSSTSLYSNYNTLQTSASTTTSDQNTIGIAYDSGDGGNSFSVYWLRVRAYPPNGVMPSISTSNPVNFPYINTSTNGDLF